VPAAGARPAVPREVSERRAEAMRGFFPKLASWYEQRTCSGCRLVRTSNSPFGVPIGITRTPAVSTPVSVAK
jgi:hypothetical protein